MTAIISRLAVLVAIAASGAVAGLALGQTMPTAREEGKRLAADLARSAQAAATAPLDGNLPNFSNAPPDTDLADNPDAIAGRAAAAAQASDGYRTVRSSLDHRPRIAPRDVAATVARGRAIAADADAYVGSARVGGAEGSCRPLPISTGGGIPYEATCNVGVKLEPHASTCRIPLRVAVRQVSGYRYWCSDEGAPGVGSCAPFEAAGCAVTGSHVGRCIRRPEPFVGSGKNSASAFCDEPTTVQELLCRQQVPGARQRGTGTVVDTVDTWDDGSCRSLANDEACSANTEQCVGGAETRIIDGVAVTRACWEKERGFTCDARVAAQDCDTLSRDPTCRLEREDCLTEDEPCATTERVYRCIAHDDQPAAPQYICDGDVYCLGGECETIDRQPNTEFKEAAVALHAATDAQNGLDPATLKLFKGSRQTCHSAVFGVLNCCLGKAFPLIPGGQLLVSLGCSREEIQLHERDNRGLCAYVGSYCSSSFLGVCTSKRKAYCCFESKLARILQVQGRAQLGKPWGKAKSESCQGFTPDEFARLDLSRMDFSEVYAEFQDAAKLPEELSTAQAMQQRIATYYDAARGR